MSWHQDREVDIQAVSMIQYVNRRLTQMCEDNEYAADVTVKICHHLWVTLIHVTLRTEADLATPFLLDKQSDQRLICVCEEYTTRRSA
ncbi:MAG: hypothetical protein U0892_15705 [Pirellulales bacterium]